MKTLLTISLLIVCLFGCSSADTDATDETPDTTPDASPTAPQKRVIPLCEGSADESSDLCQELRYGDHGYCNAWVACPRQ